MTDQQLQRLLGESLPPPALGDDAAIEALLDDASSDSDAAYGQGMLARARHPRSSGRLKNLLSLAAILVLLAIPVAILAIANLAPQSPGTAEQIDNPPATELIEFSPEFPPPSFFGTPVDIRLPNLEPARAPRLTFTAPAAVHLISHNATVTSSDPKPLLGELGMITDGLKTGDDAHFVELAAGPQWVQIDLGKPQEIFAVTLWHYHRKMRAYRDVVIEISPEESFSSGAVTIYNNDHDNSLGFGAGQDLAYIETHHGRIIDVDGIRARYIRLHSNGNTTDELNHYTEVEVYGR